MILIYSCNKYLLHFQVNLNPEEKKLIYKRYYRKYGKNYLETEILIS